MTQNSPSNSSESESNDSNQPEPPTSSLYDFVSSLISPAAANVSGDPDSQTFSFDSNQHETETNMAEPAPTVSPTFTQDQLLELLRTAGRQWDAFSTLKQPLVGGLNATGAWTGHGVGGEGTSPMSAQCMRDFKTDVIKNHQALSPIELKCKEGLSDSPDLLFSLPGEPNADKVVPSLIALSEFMISVGMESVFRIIQTDGTQLDMLLQPGMVSSDIERTWHKDLTINGVIKVDDQGRPVLVNGAVDRFAQCSYDAQNLHWSGEAVLNSCSPTLMQDLKQVIPQLADRTGPHVLFTILKKIYRPSSSKIKSLVNKLEALKLTDYPGEMSLTLSTMHLLSFGKFR
ncbi:hypothetical protein SEMRO_2406_G326550.1 [Seminavis robusta]|uniref:Uncharacterized protein n=1 Tax=Seminavis robusta TaxID=568900 RepID=A0A9N8EXZ1_9STRA|nr:hypothetical protein SEMRO_2406_G326550.1 [Seminavis robusta]|eukprot:Sro2406_g326550.1 n/a (344) ;mRNA; r:5490-6521